MTIKKGASKKSIKASQSSQEHMSLEEHSLIEESFNLIKTLNSQVSNVEKAKNKLEIDVSKLAKKIDTHDAKKHYNSLFSSIKEEIIKDFSPLLKKLDIKGVKVDVFDEISKLLEVELTKLRAEFDSKTTKSKKEFQKILSDLEVRVVDALKQSTALRSEFKDFDGKVFLKLITKLEKKLDSSLQKISLKSEAELSSSIKEVSALKTTLTKQSRDFSKSLKEFTTLKDTLFSRINEEEIDFTSFESKVLSLQKEMDSLKSLVERFENDLYSDSSQEQVSKLKKQFASMKNSFVELQTYTTSQLNSLTSQLEGVGDIEASVNESLMKQSKSQQKLAKELDQLKISFKEEKQNKKSLMEVKDLKEKLQKVMLKETDSFKTKVEKEIHLELFKIKDQVMEELERINQDSEKTKKELGDFKSQSQALLKNYLDELHTELQTILTTSETTKESIALFTKEYSQKLKDIEHSQEGVQTYISSKYNEIVDSFEKLSLLQKKELEVHKQELGEANKILVGDIHSSIKEKLSEEILKLQEFKTHSQTALKEFQRNLSEEVEEKFISSKVVFDKEFKGYLSDFEKELHEKESDFVSKLLIIEEDKKSMIADLHEFKGEITSLTKQYSNSLHDELENLKKEDLAFEEKKKDFLKHIDDVIHVRRVQLEEDFELYKGRLMGFTTDIRNYFTEQDNSFRTSFGEKVKNLHDFLDSSLQKIEKKFVEKNVSKVKLELDTEFKRLGEIAKQLESKEVELTKKLEIAEQKELEFFESLHLEQQSLQEKVEGRLMTLEKQFNKRFLDFDNQFANFKGIVVEEVEDLMKEVQSLVKQKFDVLDNYETKLKVLVSEGERKIHELHDVQSIVDREVRDIRDELSDIRVKVDVQHPDLDITSLSSLVSTMSEYENHLLGLVETLKQKGVVDSQILDVLASKGHPRVYAKMILDSISVVEKRSY